MSQATCWIKKNWRKKFQIFFIFHRGDPYDFSKKISQKIFLKNHKGPLYEKWKNMKFFFFNFFCPTCSLGHPKMPVRSFFEKSLTNFECVLFVRPRILTTSPFGQSRFHLFTAEVKYSIAGVEFLPAKQFILSSFVLYFYLSRGVMD